jgi:peptidyl-prolyl cis-trans isomerase C
MHPKNGARFCALAIALVLAGAASPGWSAETQASEVKVATVNESVITQKDFDDEIGRVRQMFLSRGKALSDSELAGIKKEVLESLINRELLYQESQKKGIEADEAAVDDQIGRLKKRFSSEAEFQSALSKMNLSESAIRSQMRQEMAIQKLIDEQFAQKVTVSNTESRAYYDSNPDSFHQPEEVRASHILIKVDPQAGESEKAKARREIEAIQERLRKGEDFPDLAREFSQGPSSARGGDLNYFSRGQMVKPFEDVAFALRPGEVSGIVETKFGYHLIKVTDKKPEATIAYEDIKERIQQYLKQQKIQGETRLYIDQLKEKADVKRFLDVGP